MGGTALVAWWPGGGCINWNRLSEGRRGQHVVKLDVRKTPAAVQHGLSVRAVLFGGSKAAGVGWEVGRETMASHISGNMSKPGLYSDHGAFRLL